MMVTDISVNPLRSQNDCWGGGGGGVEGRGTWHKLGLIKKRSSRDIHIKYP